MAAVAQGRAATEVNLDKVKAQFTEEQVAILLVVSKKAHALGYRILVVPVSAGICPRVTIDTGFQAKCMDMVNDRLQSLGETLGVCLQTPCLYIAPAEVSVVYINICITCLCKSAFLYRSCGFKN